jgi:tetratricopeptide (TPR) repeat protein
MGKPDVSIVVIVYNMAREAPRTLRSLSADYQRHIGADDYEVIVVDNGSMPPLDPKVLDGLAGNFRLIRLDPARPSPAHAINVGLAAANGDVIGVMIDGARMVTPGFLHFGRNGVRLYPRAVVASLGWYLGFDFQKMSIVNNYNQSREDALLESIGWPNDGYRLFEIGALDESSIGGWFAPISESNGLFLSRNSWDRLGGVEERFDAPGGGFLNLDTLIRAVELPDSELVILLGEATFHQLHGGIATNSNWRYLPQSVVAWRTQYESIRGRPWSPVAPPRRTYLGVLPRAALVLFARSVVEPIGPPPLGPTFDRALWSLAPSPRPADATSASLLDLAENEFRARRFEAAAAVGRMARSAAPDEPGPQRFLASASPWLRGGEPTGNGHAQFHLARAKAYRLLGEISKATAEFRAALDFEPDLVEAHVGLSEMRLPGEGYLSWLAHLHGTLSPETYLEIGILEGRSLCLAQPPTRAIGIDPAPRIKTPFKAETHIFCETSDAFFATARLAPLLNDRPLDLAFIDGLHRFEQALKDFMHLEAYCGPKSVIMLHDTIPLDEPTQRRNPVTKFYSGDVWKTVLCLKHYRPDLDIFTIATPWTGLTVITGLDPASRVLANCYDEAIKQFIDVPYSEIENRLHNALNIVPNDRREVEARLSTRGVLSVTPQVANMVKA